LDGRTPAPVRQELAACRRKSPPGAVDVHMHIGPSEFGGPDFTAADAVAAMNAWGIRCGVVSHMAAVSAGDIQGGNQDLLAACHKYPGRIFGWATFDAGQPELSVKSCRKLLQDKSIVGFKIHQSTDGRLLGDEGYEAMLDIANRLSLPILVHENQHDKWEATLEKITGKWPKAQILHAHHGGTADPVAARQIAERLVKFPNLWYETSTSFAPPDAVGNLVRAGAGKRLCFGSDLGFMDIDGQVGKVLFADLTTRQKADVFRNNSRRLIRRLHK
jgi:predicted TIM-barrel fold metal-dependent hydrolase